MLNKRLFAVLFFSFYFRSIMIIVNQDAKFGIEQMVCLRQWCIAMMYAPCLDVMPKDRVLTLLFNKGAEIPQVSWCFVCCLGYSKMCVRVFFFPPQIFSDTKQLMTIALPSMFSLPADDFNGAPAPPFTFFAYWKEIEGLGKLPAPGIVYVNVKQMIVSRMQ